MSETNNKRQGQQQNTEKKKKQIKPYHRIKAHANPLSDSYFDYPVSPGCYDWSKHYKKTLTEQPEKKVTIADVGCGYGGLLVGLANTFPDNLALGLEIRDKVVQYVEDRIDKLRIEHQDKNQYENISVLKTNAMKYLPNLFYKGQLEKIFFLFPDPHFKKANHKRRIISPALLSEYAYVIKVGGLAYFISDVEELYLWMLGHFRAHPLFEELKVEPADDPCIPLILNATEEGRKVNRIDGKKWYGVFRRIEASDNSNTTTTTTTTTTS